MGISAIIYNDKVVRVQLSGDRMESNLIFLHPDNCPLTTIIKAHRSLAILY